MFHRIERPLGECCQNHRQPPHLEVGAFFVVKDLVQSAFRMIKLHFRQSYLRCSHGGARLGLLIKGRITI